MKDNRYTQHNVPFPICDFHWLYPAPLWDAGLIVDWLFKGQASPPSLSVTLSPLCHSLCHSDDGKKRSATAYYV